MDLLYHDMYHKLKQFRIHDCSNSWCMVTFLNWQRNPLKRIAATIQHQCLHSEVLYFVVRWGFRT